MVTHVGIALVFGLVVLAVIYTLGDISGAHINPAVTIAFWQAREFPGHKVIPYIICQISGAIFASALVYLLFLGHPTYGATVPAYGIMQTFILEIILTFILMLTIINVATGAKEQGITAGIAIGSVVALEALFAGPISGASMNPARSIAPALISGQWEVLWVYITAPVIGACLAVNCCRCLKNSPCCR
jgi:aquaporin Z